MAGTVVLTIPGAPRTKKTSNTITRVGKRLVVKPSAAWLAWRDDVLSWWLQTFTASRRPTIPAKVPVNCAALFYREARVGDASGFYQGLGDVLQELGVVPNDAQIAQWDGSRLLVDRARPRVELTLTPL